MQHLFCRRLDWLNHLCIVSGVVLHVRCVRGSVRLLLAVSLRLGLLRLVTLVLMLELLVLLESVQLLLP